jgi:hypothetical protein
MVGYAVPASELGITFGPTLGRPEEMQMIGAYGVFFLFLVWLARHHLLDVSKQSLFLKPIDLKQVEWFDVRLSFWGMLIGFILLDLWFFWQGMAPTTALLLISSFFMISLVATRIICQGGIAYFTLTAAPIDGLDNLFRDQDVRRSKRPARLDQSEGAVRRYAGIADAVAAARQEDTLLKISDSSALLRTSADPGVFGDGLGAGHDDAVLPLRHQRTRARMGHQHHPQCL